MNRTFDSEFDMWCEQAMWSELTGTTQTIEYAAAITGLLMCFVPFTLLCCWHKPTFGLVILGVSFILLGVGTFIYHWIPEDPMSVPMDWIPMTITMTIVILIHVWLINDQELCVQIVFSTLFVAWFFIIFFTIATSIMTYNQVSALLVAIPALIFLFHNIYVSSQLPGDHSYEIAEIWALLVLSLVLWLLDVYLCKQFHWMAIFHSVYHLTISLAIWWASIIADLSIMSHYKPLPPVP